VRSRAVAGRRCGWLASSRVYPFLIVKGCVGEYRPLFRAVSIGKAARGHRLDSCSFNRLMHSVVMSRPLVVCVSIGLFLLDVGLAILLIRKSAAAHLAGFACCVPTISNGPPIGYRFLNVTRR
jgi:hypothetical protein